jgi:hypothetical protein
MGDIDKSLTFYLFARPSFLEGLARILDLSGSLQEYNYSKSGEQADARAISSDWEMIGEDIRTSIRTYGEEEEQKSAKSPTK